MTRKVLRSMTDGICKTAAEMDTNADAIRQMIHKGFIERLPVTYRITEAGKEFASVVPVSPDEARAKDNARKAKQRRAMGMKEYAPRTAQTRYPKKRRPPKETKEQAVERVLRSATNVPNSVFDVARM